MRLRAAELLHSMVLQIDGNRIIEDAPFHRYRLPARRHKADAAAPANKCQKVGRSPV